MEWRFAGEDGAVFQAAASQNPGWWWIFRPRNEGGHRYDPTIGLLMPIWCDGARVLCPLADLRELGDMVCEDLDRGLRYGTFFAGPIAPGPSEGSLSLHHGLARGFQPPAPGWRWCRTRAPLQHVDADGIGPIYLRQGRDGRVWVWPAVSVGGPLDIWELGFSEPLVTPHGVIDGDGEAGRVEAEFFGPIPEPPTPPAEFPVL